MLRNTLIILILTAAVGAGTYETVQTFRLRGRVQAIQREQAPLVEHIKQLQRERDEATNELASLRMENGRWKSGSRTAELQSLRVEVAQLKSVENQTKSDPAESEVIPWLNRVNQLKQYVQEHPDEGIPEFQFLTDREWLLIAATEQPETGWSGAVEELKSQAEPRFAQVVESALQKYSQANGGQFPGDFSQLQSYCDASVEAILQQRYEIKPASILPASAVKDQQIKTGWVIAGTVPIASNTADHIAIYTNGYTFFW